MHKLIAIAAAFLTTSLAGAAAEVYPARPITVVVPYPAGGPTDTLARILADHMRTSLGQSVIVENVTGGGGSIGVGRVARAAADGYTLSIGHWNTHVVHGATLNLPFHVLNDFEPVALLADTPIWLVARKALPPNDLKELIAWLRENPGKATAGTVGVGGASDVNGVYFQNVTGTKFQFVPYRGSAPLNQDLVAGHIDLNLGMAAASYPLVRNGQIKAYAMMAKTRWWAAPDVPTMEEAGVPGLYASFWHGLWVPKGMPAPVIARLNTAVRAALADPAVQQRFAEQGQEIPPAEQQTPQALGAHQKAEIENRHQGRRELKGPRSSGSRYRHDGIHHHGRRASRIAPYALRPRWRVRAERDGWLLPARGRLRHGGGVTHGAEPAEPGRRLLQPVAHVVKAGIGTSKIVDASEPAQPKTCLREGDANVPAAASLGASRERRHRRKGHQVTRGVVEHLRRQGPRLARAKSFRFGGIEAARRLHQRVEAAPTCPRAFLPIGAERNVDNPGPHACDIVRTKAERRDGAWPVALHEHVRIPQQ
jgi:tripartite-type tricarboxylate transporter receptor subunit TctC